MNINSKPAGWPASQRRFEPHFLGVPSQSNPKPNPNKPTPNQSRPKAHRRKARPNQHKTHTNRHQTKSAHGAPRKMQKTKKILRVDPVKPAPAARNGTFLAFPSEVSKKPRTQKTSFIWSRLKIREILPPKVVEIRQSIFFCASAAPYCAEIGNTSPDLNRTFSKVSSKKWTEMVFVEVRQ